MQAEEEVHRQASEAREQHRQARAKEIRELASATSSLDTFRDKRQGIRLKQHLRMKLKQQQEQDDEDAKAGDGADEKARWGKFAPGAECGWAVDAPGHAWSESHYAASAGSPRKGKGEGTGLVSSSSANSGGAVRNSSDSDSDSDSDAMDVASPKQGSGAASGADPSQGRGNSEGGDNASVLTQLTWMASDDEEEEEGSQESRAGSAPGAGGTRRRGGALSEMADEEALAMFPIGGLQRPSPLIETPRVMQESTQKQDDGVGDSGGSGSGDRDEENGKRAGALLPAVAPRGGDVLPAGVASVVEVLLRTIDTSRASVRRACMYMIDNAPLGPEHMASWIGDALTLPATPLGTRLARLYLVSDLLANASAPVPGVGVLCAGLQRRLPEAVEAAGAAAAAAASSESSRAQLAMDGDESDSDDGTPRAGGGTGLLAGGLQSVGSASESTMQSSEF